MYTYFNPPPAGQNRHGGYDNDDTAHLNPLLGAKAGCPSFGGEHDTQHPSCQAPLDLIDEESMESFPCSDPPSYSTCHA